MPAMTARVWENLWRACWNSAGLRGGRWAEPLPLLSACAVPPSVGNSRRRWGAAVGTVTRLPSHRPSADTVPSLREVGERSPFPQSVACPTFCFEFTRVIFLTSSAVPAALFPPASSLWWLGYFSHDSLRLDVAVPCLCQSNPNLLL